jgi:hypothetical protein
VRHEDARSCADRYSEDRDILRVSKVARPFAVMWCRAVDVDGNCAEELLEERSGFRELGGQIQTNLRHSGIREHQTKEAKLANAKMDPYAVKAWCWKVLADANEVRPPVSYKPGIITHQAA